MNIVILGAGSLGSFVASTLSKEEHNVILIDKDIKKLNILSRDLDVATMHGYGSNWKLFDDLLENGPQFFIALTGDDETNLTACSVAKNLGYPHTICRIKDIGYLTRSRLDFFRLFYIDHFIAPEILAAHDILKILISPTNIGIENFAHGAVQMRTITIPDSWSSANIPIKDLSLPEEIVIGVIHRKEQEEKIIFPHGDDIIKPRDEITIIGQTTTMIELSNFFNIPKIKIDHVTIIGGSAIGLHLGKLLENQGTQVKILEENESRCGILAEHLKNSIILNHDGKDFQFLLSEKIKDSNALITCTRCDETNIFLSMLAKQAGCEKVIALISDAHLNPPLRNLEIIPSISEKINISNRILSIINEEKIISIASLFDNRAHVVELKVSPDSKLIGIPLSELASHIPKDLLIAVIENKGKVMVGKGNRILSPYDTAIIISAPKHLQELKDLF